MIQYTIIGLIVSIAIASLLTYILAVVNSKESYKKYEPKLDIDEHILTQATAGYFYKVQTFGGYLYLTNKRLYFAALKGLLDSPPIYIDIPVNKIQKAYYNENKLIIEADNDIIEFKTDDMGWLNFLNRG